MRGQADGFTIDFLPKLKECKSNENNYTFLHFIVNKYIESCGANDKPEDAKLPVPEPSDLQRASAINFDALDTELKTLETELKTCEGRVTVVIDTSSPEQLEPFREKMTKFLSQATDKMKEMRESFVHTKGKFNDTLAFFDFAPNKSGNDSQPALEFFSTWSEFCQDFKTIWRNEQQKILKESKKEAEKMIKQKRSLLQNLIVKKPRESGGLRDKIKKKRESMNKQ